jgi:hypothetical protein
MQTVVSNKARKFRASVDRTPSAYPKGNAHNSNTARGGAKDTKAAFPQIAFGNELPYRVDPYNEVGGVFFPVSPPAYRGKPVRIGEPKAEKTNKTTAKRRRQDPGPGTRPSLSKIRKG